MTFPPPGNLSYPGIEPISPALAGGVFITEPLGSILDSGCTNLHFNQQFREGSLFSTTSLALIVDFFYNDHSDWCEVIPHCSFDLQCIKPPLNIYIYIFYC